MTVELRKQFDLLPRNLRVYAQLARDINEVFLKHLQGHYA